MSATDTRIRLQFEALRLVVEKGIDAASVRDIATAAGVSDAALYRHYDSKGALIDDLYRSHHAAFARDLEAARSAAPDDPVEEMVLCFCRFFDSDPLRFRFLLLVHHDQLLRLAPAVPNPADVVLNALSALKTSGLCVGSPDLVAALLIGQVVQVATSIICGRLPGPMAPYAPTLGAAIRAVMSVSSCSAPKAEAAGGSSVALQAQGSLPLRLAPVEN